MSIGARSKTGHEDHPSGRRRATTDGQSAPSPAGARLLDTFHPRLSDTHACVDSTVEATRGIGRPSTTAASTTEFSGRTAPGCVQPSLRRRAARVHRTTMEPGIRDGPRGLEATI